MAPSVGTHAGKVTRRWWPRGLLARALLSALAFGGCTRSFDFAPTEVPKLRTGTVRTPDGEAEPLPEVWKAEVIARDPPGTMQVGYPRQRLVLTEKRVRFGSSAQVGLAPLGFGPAAWSGAPPPGQPARRARAPLALWLRDEQGRIVEIPVADIDRVHVWDPGVSDGAIAWMVIGPALGVILVNTAFLGWGLGFAHAMANIN
jgi:hypothetical protein